VVLWALPKVRSYAHNRLSTFLPFPLLRVAREIPLNNDDFFVALQSPDRNTAKWGLLYLFEGRGGAVFGY
jgi:hypothetical protein